MKIQKTISIIAIIIAISISFMYNIKASDGENIMEQEFLERIKHLENQINEMGRSRQLYQGDWFSLNVSEFSYNSNNVLNTTRDFRSTFSKGDKVRINQGGYKYFYITQVSSNSITVYAGTDYIFTNASFTEFAFSKFNNPINFPLVFNYESNLRTLSGSVTKTNVNTKFSINGSQVFVFANFLTFTPAINEQIVFDSPFGLAPNSLVYQYGWAIMGMGSPNIAPVEYTGFLAFMVWGDTTYSFFPTGISSSVVLNLIYQY